MPDRLTPRSIALAHLTYLCVTEPESDLSFGPARLPRLRLPHGCALLADGDACAVAGAQTRGIS